MPQSNETVMAQPEARIGVKSLIAPLNGFGSGEA
jgi:hypothetical protein